MKIRFTFHPVEIKTTNDELFPYLEDYLPEGTTLEDTSEKELLEALDECDPEELYADFCGDSPDVLSFELVK